MHAGSPGSEIVPFLEDQVIFLTGVTGFLGKVILHKIFSCCEAPGRRGVHKIYVLIRAKRGVSARERFDEEVIQKSSILRELKKSMPQMMDKIEVFEGDVQEEMLGRREEDIKEILNSVTVILHGAATTKFMEPIKSAIRINVLGVKHMLEFAKKCANLVSFIHVSTAYVNCDKPDQEIDERIYLCGPQPYEVIDDISALSDAEAEKKTMKLIKPFPNTYTYSKAIGELLVERDRGDLPLAIVRPSIVVSSFAEPVPGWVDTFIGPAGLSLAAGMGVLHIMQGKSSSIADFIPVDLVSAGILAAAWATAKAFKERKANRILAGYQDRVKIYHMTSSSVNPTTWGSMGDMVLSIFRHTHTKSRHAISHKPWQRFVDSSFLYAIGHTCFHLTPALLYDFKLVLLDGKKPKMLDSMRKLNSAVSSLFYFTSHSWWYRNENTLDLISQLNTEDRRIFNFDARQLDWDVVAFVFAKGLTRYLLHEDPLRFVPTASRSSGGLWASPFWLQEGGSRIPHERDQQESGKARVKAAL